MNILIIHQHFRYPEEGGPVRSYYLGQALLKAGHDVTILTRKNLEAKKITEVDGLNIHYLPVRYYNKMSFFRRIFSYLGFVFKAIVYCSSNSFIKNTHACYCISTPLTSGIIGYWLLRVKKIPYIFEVGDLWPDAPQQMGAMKFPFAMQLSKALEKRIYANACSVIGLSPSIVEKIEERTNTAVFFVPNLSDIKFFYQKKAVNNSPFVISYTGAMGRANGLENLLLAARESQSQSLSVDFYIMGRGAAYDHLKELVKKQNINNVYFIPFGNKQEVKKVLDRSHAIYVSYKKLPILETGSPNKFFDGLAAGKLVILNFGGWLAQLVKQYNCGFHYDPDNPAEFTAQLKLYIDSPQLLQDAQKNALRMAEEKFALEEWEERFAQIIKKQVEKC